MRYWRSLRLTLSVAFVFMTVSACDGALQAPTGLTATALAGTNLIRLTWTDSNKNETGFRIERSTDGVTFAQIATVGADVTTYQNAVTACARYYYRVRAIATETRYRPTPPWRSTVATDTIPPSQPGFLTASAVSCSQINLSWGASTDACGVSIYRLYRNGAFWKDVASSTTSTADTGRAGGTAYTYTVYAVDTAGALGGQDRERDDARLRHDQHDHDDHRHDDDHRPTTTTLGATTTTRSRRRPT
jgi:chitodextrinase